jgi:hypothetical protein
MSNLENALKELREKRSQAQIEIEKIDQIIAGIESLNGTGVMQKLVTQSRVISADSRRKMALAQKARWANIRNGSKPAETVTKTKSASTPKRTMSAAARRKIAVAQKARWAKIRAQQKMAA